MPANRNVTSVETYTGRYVDLIHPSAADITLEDIAVGLSNTARFAGQISRFYSVAEHAVRVSQMVQELAPASSRPHGLWPSLALAALHHDSHEAYLGDIAAPMKATLRQLGAGDAIELIATRLDSAIGAKLSIFPDTFHDARIKAADDEAMYHEASALKWSHGVGDHWQNDTARTPWAGIGWSPSRAERLFVARHEELAR